MCEDYFICAKIEICAESDEKELFEIIEETLIKVKSPHIRNRHDYSKASNTAKGYC